MTDLQVRDLDIESVRDPSQLVNESPRGVLLTHMPTGIQVRVTSAPSRVQNMAIALEALRLEVNGVQRLW